MPQPVKDVPTVTPRGDSLLPRIDGVVVHKLTSIEDRRGEIVEVYRPSWALHPDPLVYVYQVSVRVKAIKGWVQHKLGEDRIFHSQGVLHWVLYDDRDGSPTRGMLNHFTFSERSRSLLIIPRGVYHAVQNIGDREAFFLNMPSRAYDHADPDKFRLPVRNDRIPFAFDDGRGF